MISRGERSRVEGCAPINEILLRTEMQVFRDIEQIFISSQTKFVVFIFVLLVFCDSSFYQIFVWLFFFVWPFDRYKTGIKTR